MISPKRFDIFFLRLGDVQKVYMRADFTLKNKRVCMATTYNRVWINRVRLPVLSHGQLNRENIFFPAPVCAREFGLARRVWPSRPASACSCSILRMNLELIYRIPPISAAASYGMYD